MMLIVLLVLQLRWMPIQCTTRRPLYQRRSANSCQGTTILRESSGVISSPNYPYYYRRNTNCVWKIMPPPSTKFIIFNFQDFHLEGESSCSFDYVEIRKGNTPRSPLLTRLCGNKIDTRLIIKGRSVFVRFRTDGTLNYKGFRVMFEAGRKIQDLCEQNWKHFQNSSYKVCSYSTPWIGALKACQNMGADLVKIETEEENTFLFNHQTQHPQVWIGLTRGPDNRFYWSDGSRPGYTKWAYRQPDNWRQAEHCGSVREKRSYWNDRPCNENKLRFVCEKSKCEKTPLVNSSSIITASSVRGANLSAAHNWSWCPQSNSTSEWLQVDLGKLHVICGLSAVNLFSVGNSSSVTWYQTFTSLTQFVEDPQTRYSSKTRRTDINPNTAVIHEYTRLARYIRFVPIRSVNWPCMKVQIYGDSHVVPPKMAIPLMNKTVEHASAVELRCIASSYPFPRYSWTKNGSSVIPNGLLSQENTVLRISPVSWKHEGLYTCSATNSVGSVSSSAYLAVHSKPKDLKFQTVIIGLTGSDVVLTCESTASPVPNVTWINDNIDLSSGKYFISTNLIPSSNILVSNITVRNVTINDVGFYKCRFWNLHGSIDGTIQLDVVDDCSKVIFDFEDGPASLKDWGRTGTAFNNQPTYGDNVKARRKDQVANNQGDYWIGTYENRPDNSTPPGSKSGDFPQGSMISPEFRITGANVSFFIGGGCSYAREAAQLLVGGRVVRVATNICHERMTKTSWNLQPYIGRKARLRLIDFSSARWGHINFDEFKGDVSICRGCLQPLGMTTSKIPDFAVTASSMFSVKHAPKYARLYTLNRDGHYSTWCPRRNRVGEWIQVDLGTFVMVTKIATQGRTEYPGWTKEYTLKYSVNGTKFENYQNDKLFVGNSDRDTIVEHFLVPPIQGRLIRVYPQSWNRFISLRMELYGCPPKPVSPKIFGLQKQITKERGLSVSLLCAAKGFPYISYRWIKRDQANRTKMVSGPSLELTNITEKNSGVYSCIAFNEVGRDSYDVHLNVQTFPSVIDGMEKLQIGITGNTITLTCHAKGNPPPVAVWLKNGRKMNNTRRVKILSVKMNTWHNTTLAIETLEYKDSANYTCEFINALGATNSSGTLLVHGLPQFTLSARSRAIVMGDGITLPCAAMAIPSPHIRWMFNGNYLHDSNNFILDGTNLVIKKVENNPLFEGNYTCEASNYVGKISTMSQLKVYERPRFRNHLQGSVNVPRGQSIVLHCSADGDPKPEIEWRKDGVPLELTKGTSLQGKREILLIQNSKAEDTGLYVCSARNIVGNITSSSNIYVFGKPKIDVAIARKKVYTPLGYPANLMCLATNPLPIRYIWSKDGETIRNSTRIKVYKNILVVLPKRSKDFGTYVCNATNIAGSANYSIELIQQNQQPSLLTASANKLERKKTSSGLSSWVPLLVLVIILLVAVILLGYRYLQLRRRSTSCSKLDTIGLVTYDKARDEHFNEDGIIG